MTAPPGMHAAPRSRRYPRKCAPRGVALLLVLATLLTVVVAASIVASTAGTERAGRHADVDALRADDLADAAVTPVLAWLGQRSESVVIPPDTDRPMVQVIDDAWLAMDGATMHGATAQESPSSGGGVWMRVQIVAWDQRAMIPWSIAARTGGLAALLPSDVRAVVANLTPPKGVPLGLDLVPSTSARAAYPTAPETEPRRRSAVGIDPATSSGPDPQNFRGGGWARAMTAKALPAIGELVATHADGAFLLNVNTAPRALLEAVAADAQITLPDSIWEERAAGKPVTGGLPGLGRARGSSANDGRPAFVTSSDRWAVRIDATVGRARSSWWLVVGRSDRGDWVVIQRLRITSESLEWPATL